MSIDFGGFLQDTMDGKFLNNLATNSLDMISPNKFTFTNSFASNPLIPMSALISPANKTYDFSSLWNNTKDLLGNQTFWNGLATAGSLWNGYNDGKIKKKMFNMAQDQYNFNKQMVLDEKKRQKQMSDNLANIWGGK